MSDVYLGEQVSLGRKVALKVLRQDMRARTGAPVRFQREAQLLASVDHPAVVRVIDFEQSAEATVLVLELAEGETLESVLMRGPLPPSRAVALMVQLAEGLAAIHEKGIVHRDLKPQNVVLSPTPRGEQARLLDFGIAKLAELPEGMVSQPGQVVGTPAYLAPEQAGGQNLDSRTDVYSFGVVAYRLLTGMLPLPGPSPREFMLQHMFAAPRPIDEANPALKEHPELCALVMRCLEKNPDRRPVSGASLLAELSKLPPIFAVQALSSSDDALAFAPTVKSKIAPERGDTTLQWGAPKRRSRTLMRRVLERTREAAKKVPQLAKAAGQAFLRLDRRWRQALVVSALLLLAAPAVYGMLPRTPAARAQELLENGRPDEALPVIDAALLTATGEAPELHAMKAAALHLMQRHEDERQVLVEHKFQALYSAHPLLLEALAEDFAEAEDDVLLREFMAAVPEKALEAKFVELAAGPLSKKQWGALRYLDVSGLAPHVDRVSLYASSLMSVSCEVRAAAAKRLGEIGDDDAIGDLRRLSETPKEDWAGGRNCGQDEAAEAIRQLKKRLQ